MTLPAQPVDGSNPPMSVEIDPEPLPSSPPNPNPNPLESTKVDSNSPLSSPAPAAVATEANDREEPVVSVWGMMPALIVLTLAAAAWIGAEAGWFDDRSVEYVRLAEQAMADGDYNLARLCYTRLVEQRGNMPDDLRGLALALLRQGDVQAAGALRDYLTPSDLAELIARDSSHRSPNDDQGTHANAGDPRDDPQTWNHAARLELARVQIETDDFEKAARTLEPGWRVTRLEEYRQMLARLYLAWFDRAQRLNLPLPLDFWERVVVHLADHEDLQPIVWRRLTQGESSSSPSSPSSAEGRQTKVMEAEAQTNSTSSATGLWERLTRLARGANLDEREFDAQLVVRVAALGLGAARCDDLNDIWPTARVMVEAVPNSWDQVTPSLKAARLWLRQRLEPDSAADLQEQLDHLLNTLEGPRGNPSQP